MLLVYLFLIDIYCLIYYYVWRYNIFVFFDIVVMVCCMSWKFYVNIIFNNMFLINGLILRMDFNILGSLLVFFSNYYFF